MSSDLLTRLLSESANYQGLEDIEKLLESSTDLQAVPLQPLYLAVQSASADHVAHLLPKLSREQRKLLLELDLWQKDEVDVARFEQWPAIYAHCADDEVREEFAQSEEFGIYLKGRFSIHTFDVEDPEYPDNDNYFLTEDNLLLIEYDEDANNFKEVQSIIKNLYTKLGVENAYAHLFKFISEDYLVLQEAVFEDKKERLRDYGFVDYYEALELRRALTSIKQLKDYLLKKNVIQSNLDNICLSQALHSQSVRIYQGQLDEISKELALLKNEQRIGFLHFNFIRLVNASLSLNDAFIGGSLAMTKIGKIVKQKLDLAFSFVKSMDEFKKLDEGIFSKLDFFDLYLTGNTLIEVQQKKLKKGMANSFLKSEESQKFIGAYWDEFLEKSFDELVSCKIDGQWVQIKDEKELLIWTKQSELFETILPYIGQFWAVWDNLVKEGHLSNSFYLNYELEEIDFESLIVTSMVNFDLGLIGKSDEKKMAISIDELNSFVSKYFDVENGQSRLMFKLGSLSDMVKKFWTTFGLAAEDATVQYFVDLFKIHLEGYAFGQLSKDDFKHVGGPILLAK